MNTALPLDLFPRGSNSLSIGACLFKSLPFVASVVFKLLTNRCISQSGSTLSKSRKLFKTSSLVIKPW